MLVGDNLSNQGFYDWGFALVDEADLRFINIDAHYGVAEVGEATQTDGSYVTQA